MLKEIKICYKAHKGQKDKGGRPYIFHPIHVALRAKGKARKCALLHDVVEDSDYTFEDLKCEGIDDDVIEVLKILTKDKSISYEDYIKKIKQNDIATEVKLLDLAHNSDLKRLKEITDDDRARLEKYKRAMEILLKK